jgi:hypothetical protein
MRVGTLAAFGRCGYVEMTRFLMIKILLLCRLFTGVTVRSIHGRLYYVWRIATYLGGLFMVGGHDGGYFYQHGWTHNLRIGVLHFLNVDI